MSVHSGFRDWALQASAEKRDLGAIALKFRAALAQIEELSNTASPPEYLHRLVEINRIAREELGGTGTPALSSGYRERRKDGD